MAINLSAFAGAGAQFFDDNGDPLARGLLYTYASGTTTPIVTYTTQLGTVNNQNPIELDAGGRTPNEIWVNGGVLYKFRLTTSAGVLIGDYDNIPAIDDPTVFNNLISVTGTNTLTGTSVPPIIGYVAGATYSFIPINTNTGAVTIDIDGFGAKEILYDSSTSLSAGAIQAGKMVVIEYDGTRFQLVNSFTSGQIPDGSITVAKFAADTRSDVASATTISLTALSPATRNIRITGSTGPIGTFTVAAGFDYFVVFSGAPTITNSASIVTNTNADIVVAAGDSCIIRSTAANVVEILNYTRALPFLRGYIDGLIMSTAGSSATMAVAAGQATDSTNAVMLNLAASISKTTSAWAVGTAQGGKLSAAAIANSTWYYFYLIRRTDTGVVDVGFDVSATSPTMPTNYTQYRYIGAGLTDGSAQWVAFIQDGDRFSWLTVIEDVDATSAGTSAVSRTLTVPRKRVEAVFQTSLTASASGEAVYVSDLSTTDSAPSGTDAPGQTIQAGANQIAAGQMRVFTNTSAQIRTRQATGGASDRLRINTLGWIDSRGKNA